MIANARPDRLSIHCDPLDRPTDDMVDPAFVKCELLAGRWFRYRQVDLVTRRRHAFANPFKLILAARLMSRDICRVMDDSGSQQISWPALLIRAFSYGRDSVAGICLRRRVQRDARQLEDTDHGRLGSGNAIYLVGDPRLRASWGGMATHMRGVLGGMRLEGQPVRLLTTDPRVTTFAADIGVPVDPLPAIDRFWDFPEMALAASADVVVPAARDAIGDRGAAFVYQRNAPFDLSGLRLARSIGAPLVIEYNGSEPWMARHWGRPLRHERLASAVETANLRGADVVVTVSRASADEAIGRGADPKRIVTIPNGVDPERFSPRLDGAAIRTRLGLADGIVIGFSGSFGPWHGTEVLARAFLRLERTAARLLLIGDGDRLTATRRIVEEASLGNRMVVAGPVDPDEMPSYLAACDILVSPQVAFPEDTPFFGSPTKLFEYMAMGRAVVASDLGQIRDIVDDGRTGLLAVQGDEISLAHALRRLIDDPELRRRLGDDARREVQAKYTWRHHARHILDKIASTCR